MPPPSVTRSALKSSLSNPGVFSSALNSVLTPEMYVNGCLRSSPTKLGKSRGFTIRMFFQPSITKNRQFAVSAKM